MIRCNMCKNLRPNEVIYDGVCEDCWDEGVLNPDGSTFVIGGEVHNHAEKFTNSYRKKC